MSHLNKDSISIWVKKLKGFLVNHNLLAINPKRSQFEIFWRCLCYKWYFETWNWAIVSMGKCLLLFEQISFGQMSKWAKYFWAIYFGQMSRGKCRLRNGLSTISVVHFAGASVTLLRPRLPPERHRPQEPWQHVLQVPEAPRRRCRQAILHLGLQAEDGGSHGSLRRWVFSVSSCIGCVTFTKVVFHNFH